jgi:hypothetical protein
MQRRNRVRKHQSEEEMHVLESEARAGVHAAKELLKKRKGHGSDSDEGGLTGEDNDTPYKQAMREEKRFNKLAAIRRAQEEADRPPSPKTQKILDVEARQSLAARISKREAVKREKAREETVLERRRHHHIQQIRRLHSDSDSDSDSDDELASSGTIYDNEQYQIHHGLRELEQQLAANRVQAPSSSYLAQTNQLPAVARA